MTDTTTPIDLNAMTEDAFNAWTDEVSRQFWEPTWERDYMHSDELAYDLFMDPRTLRHRVRSGELPFRMVPGGRGNHWIIARSDVQAWKEEQDAATTTD